MRHLLAHIAAFTSVWLLASSCLAPVRTSVFPSRGEKKPEGERVILPPKLVDKSKSATASGRQKQPLVYDERGRRISTYEQPKPRAVHPDVDAFEGALSTFDTGDIDAACAVFADIAARRPTGDSLRYEAMFMEAECKLQRQDVLEALEALYLLTTTPRLPAAVQEKALLRLGQTYCIIDDTKSAQEIFDEFKSLFPNSQYRELANCDILR